MRRWVAVVALLTAVGLVAGVAAIAAGGRENTSIPRKTVLTFLDITVDDHLLDVGPRALSPGDTFFSHDQLWNLTRTQKRGTLDAACTVLIGAGANSRVHCRATVFLAGGTVELAGTPRADQGNRFFAAVVGGTKRYKNVTGEARFTPLRGNRSRLVLELIPASAGAGGPGLAGR